MEKREEVLKQEEKYELRTSALEAGVEAEMSLKVRVGMVERFFRSLLIVGQKDLGLEERDLKNKI